MQTQNLFQVFSEVFIESQHAFNKCEIELRTKCRTLSEKLNRLAEDLETDVFNADMALISTIEEETLHIVRNALDLEDRRENIKESVRSLKTSTKTKVRGRK